MFDARLAIYEKSETVNSYGETQTSTSLLRSMWAEEMSISIKEKWVAESDRPDDLYKFKARFNEWLIEDHEIQFDGGRFVILSIEPAGHQLRQFLIIKARRIT